MALPGFNKEQQKTLSKLGVEALYLFGSRAQDVKSPLADYDYAVLTKKRGHNKGDELYLTLYDILSLVSPRTLKNDVIDIVFLRDAGLELRFHVIRYGKVLFETDLKARLDFESETTLLYCDYRPLLDAFDRTILQSL